MPGGKLFTIADPSHWRKVTSSTPGIRATGYWEADSDGRMVCRALIIEAQSRGLTRDSLRGLDLPTADRQANQTTSRGKRLTQMPPDGALSDEYLTRVVMAYHAAVDAGRAPAPAIAADTGANVRTVRSWIHKARLRGLMAPGRAGQMG